MSKFEDLYLGKWEPSPTDIAIYEVAKSHDVSEKHVRRAYEGPQSESQWRLAAEVERYKAQRKAKCQ